MRKILGSAAVAAILLLAGADLASADSLYMNTSPALERTLRSFGGNFDISYVHNWRHQSDRADGPVSVEQRTPSAIRHIQASINSNRQLVRRLNKRGVDVRTVVNAEQAADGSMTFYIK
ncbi:hypothetical protein FZ934_25500 (plasmid) [Rhizobium grahamii]|uniref:Uncharacterized protein n=2 Tax=Rhizobium/Agrobacterium group TaxID=227290 RepID=A0A5Q0CH77_9HYPH|nr:hypothetical protein FZ934_25500 [Rhizobium grahamii]QRM51639.1 hypothetical protein F3Y33_20145 [Rhizobium sp. BG6]